MEWGDRFTILNLERRREDNIKYILNKYLKTWPKIFCFIVRYNLVVGCGHKTSGSTKGGDFLQTLSCYHILFFYVSSAGLCVH